jgi:hypothetical protein
MAHTPDDDSTYTTNFHFEKPPNGAFEDTWDLLINDNYDLIDAAIAAISVWFETDENGDLMPTV